MADAPDGRNSNWQRASAAQRAAEAASRPADARSAQKSTRKSPDRWATFNGWVDATAGELSRAELLCWLVLFRDVRNGVARTGMTDIARRAKLTRRGVVKAISALKEKRLIEVVTRGSKGGSPNVYRVFEMLPN